MTGPTEGAEPREQGQPSGARGVVAIGRWRGIGWFVLGFVPTGVLMWLVLFSGMRTGSKADWLAGVGTFAAVVFALVQTVRIQRRATADAAEAADRLRRQIAAAEQRAATELAHARELHRVEMDAQKELAHIQRVHLLELQQKQAFAEVSRAVSVHTHKLAALWSESAKILGLEDRDEREQAMDVIMEQLGQVVQDFSAELGNAHLLIEDDRLHEALNRVNEAAIKAIRVAEDVRIAVLEGRAPDPNPIPPAQEVMRQRAADARNLALELLQTGSDD